MILKVSIQDEALAKEILKLQKRAYKVEAEWIGCNRIPPLYETLEQLQQLNELFFVYMKQDVISGAIAIEHNHAGIHICRVMVDPSSFRKGIARKLLTYVDELVGNNTSLFVSTGANNLPAIRLYTAMGFEQVGTKKVGDGLLLAQFIKK